MKKFTVVAATSFLLGAGVTYGYCNYYPGHSSVDGVYWSGEATSLSEDTALLRMLEAKQSDRVKNYLTSAIQSRVAQEAVMDTSRASDITKESYKRAAKEAEELIHRHKNVP